MGIGDTIRWAKNEWGILAKGDQMSVGERLRWLGDWVPFGARTVAYGSLSLMFGPLTPDHRASLWAMKAWSKSSLKGLDIPFVVEGSHLVPAGGLMYASNHQSLVDILVLGAALPGNLKWATKRSIMNVPFLGWHLRLSGHVPVDRKAGSRAAAQAIQRFKKVLEDDNQLLIFPEGTRTPDGWVQDFKNGGFYAAVRANKPVVPVAIDGTHFLMGKHQVDTGEVREADKRLVYVEIGEPLYPMSEGKEKDRVADLRERTRAAVVEMHAELRARAPWRTASQAAPEDEKNVRVADSP